MNIAIPANPATRRAAAFDNESARRQTARADAAILVSTFERPHHLRRCLLALAAQQEAAGRFEVVVADDGSADDTVAMVARMADGLPYPLRFTTHRHEAFQLARCRNEGVAASTAPYLVFLDGDLLAPPDFVAKHLKYRRTGIAMAGDSAYMEEVDSSKIDDEAIRAAAYIPLEPINEKRRLDHKALRGRIYQWLRHPSKPSFKGGNIALWRSDYERVNGYDENFVGWGLEETDLQWRLSRRGVRFGTSLAFTRTWHLWHPRHTTFAPRGIGTANDHYLHLEGRLSRCRRGLVHRGLEDLAIAVRGKAENHSLAERILTELLGRERAPLGEPPEVEILFSPGRGAFSGRAECNVLVVLEPTRDVSIHARRAHIVVADDELSNVATTRRFRLAQFNDAMESIS